MKEATAADAVQELIPAMTDLMSAIAKALVDDPQGVSVHAVVEGDSTVLSLRVAAADLGKVIGKQGRTARSIRTILGAASMKVHHRFALDIQETGKAQPLAST